jgi:hypothetical protein
MAAQPIYPNELNLAVDRLYVRIINYVDARIESLGVQMRLDKQESITRDNDLRSNMKFLADAILTLTQRVSTVETTQNAIVETLAAIRQDIRDGFAAQAERIGELAVRLDKLERGNNPQQPGQ